MIELLENIKDKLMGTYAGVNLKWYQLLANRVVYHHRLFCIHKYVLLNGKVRVCAKCGKARDNRK